MSENIKVEQALHDECCNCCYEYDNVKEYTFLRSEKSNGGLSIRLCKKHRKELNDMLVMNKYEVDVMFSITTYVEAESEEEAKEKAIESFVEEYLKNDIDEMAVENCVETYVEETELLENE